jgi:hypothetical protein
MIAAICSERGSRRQTAAAAGKRPLVNPPSSAIRVSDLVVPRNRIAPVRGSKRQIVGRISAAAGDEYSLNAVAHSTIEVTIKNVMLTRRE